jgi:hypothetical protein
VAGEWLTSLSCGMNLIRALYLALSIDSKTKPENVSHQTLLIAAGDCLTMYRSIRLPRRAGPSCSTCRSTHPGGTRRWRPVGCGSLSPPMRRRDRTRWPCPHTIPITRPGQDDTAPAARHHHLHRSSAVAAGATTARSRYVQLLLRSCLRSQGLQAVPARRGVATQKMFGGMPQ